MVTSILEEFAGEDGNSKVVKKTDPVQGNEGVWGTGFIDSLILNLCKKRR